MSIKMTGTNPDPARTDFQRADRDPGLTRSVEDGPPSDQVSTADLPNKAGSTTLGNIRPFYAEGNVKEIDQVVGDQGAIEPGHSSNSWVIEETDDGIERGADPYRNQGLSGPDSGRDYLDNQG